MNTSINATSTDRHG